MKTRTYKLGARESEFTKNFKPIEIEETEVTIVNATLGQLDHQRAGIKKNLDEIDGIIVEAKKLLA